MNDSTRILDLYRSNITSDHQALQILSLLYRDGPKTAEELSNLLSISTEDLNAKTRDLFQASLIEISPESYIALTDYSEFLLSRLGISQLAADSLILACNIPDLESAFLRACVKARSDADISHAKRYVYQLQSFRLAQQLLRRRHEEFATVESRVLFAIIVGLDPDSHRLGASDFSDGVIRWHSRSSSDLWQNVGKLLLDNRDFLTDSCRIASEDISESDRILSQEQVPDSKQVSATTLFTTCIRILTASLSNEPDSSLATVFWRNPELPERAWECLQFWEPRLEEDLYTILLTRPSGSQIRPSRQGSRIDTLIDRLREVLEGTSPTMGQLTEPRFLRERDLASVSVTEPIQQERDIALFQLRHLREQVDSGKYDNLSVSRRVELWKAVEALEQTIRKRLLED